LHLIGGGALLLVGIAAIGTYRIISQAEFTKYSEYKGALATKNYPDVAWISVTHYARTVPANAVLTKQLVDEHLIPYQFGKTYFTLFLTALPGQQLSPDLMIKR